jgi:Domain of unknown function (DUF4189)
MEILVYLKLKLGLAGAACITISTAFGLGSVLAASAQAQVTEPIIIECPQGTEATYFGCQVPPPPGVTYVKNWGALAVVTATREWVGVTGYSGEDKAKKALNKACKTAGQSCKTYVTFLNQCVAVARVNDAAVAAPGKETIHNGSNHQEAQAGAMQKCKTDWRAKSCTPVATYCSINRIES